MRREALQVSQPCELVDEAGEQEEADHALPNQQFGCPRPFGSLEKPEQSDSSFAGEGEDGDQGAGDRDVADAKLVPERDPAFPVEPAGMLPVVNETSIHVASSCVAHAKGVQRVRGVDRTVERSRGWIRRRATVAAAQFPSPAIVRVSRGSSGRNTGVGLRCVPEGGDGGLGERGSRAKADANCYHDITRYSRWSARRIVELFLQAGPWIPPPSWKRWSRLRLKVRR